MAFGVTNLEIVLEPHPPNSEESLLITLRDKVMTL